MNNIKQVYNYQVWFTLKSKKSIELRWNLEQAWELITKIQDCSTFANNLGFSLCITLLLQLIMPYVIQMFAL